MPGPAGYTTNFKKNYLYKPGYKSVLLKEAQIEKLK